MSSLRVKRRALRLSFAEGLCRTVRSFAEGYSLGYANMKSFRCASDHPSRRRGGASRPSRVSPRGASLPSEFRLMMVQPRVRSLGCHPCASDHPRVSPRGRRSPSEFRRGTRPDRPEFRRGLQPSLTRTSLGGRPCASDHARDVSPRRGRSPRPRVSPWGGVRRPSESFAEGVQRGRSLGVILARRTIREFRRGGRRTVRVSPRGVGPCTACLIAEATA